jgi:hypothetical protein
MIICGLDLATQSGYAFRDSDKHRSSIICGVFSVKENDRKEKLEWEAKYGVAANLFYRLIKEHKPDFVAIERPEHGVRQFSKKGKADLTGEERTVSTINPAALQLTGIAGAVIGICQVMGIPYGTVASASWRSSYYGKGVKPGPGKDWKDLAIASCNQEGIILPPTKAEQRDAAEAVGICTCWHKAELPNIAWMRARFVELRSGAYEQKRNAA